MKGEHSPTTPVYPRATALNGIRIIDLSMGWAGPLAARHLADLGADVIKVESCERFDWWRSWEATPEWIADNGAEKSERYNAVNRNKRNITLDLESTRGRELFLELVKTANAVIENFSGSVMPKLGLNYEVLKAANPNIIMVSMPAFGSTGPWHDFRAYGSTVEQASGLPHMNGLADDAPTMQHVAYGDPVAGLNGASALMVALRHQARTGEGQFVDMSHVEALFPLGSHGILHQAAMGEAPPRYGNRHPTFSPHGVYPCAPDDNGEAWLLLQVFEEPQWQALKDVTGPALQRFAASKFDHAAERVNAAPEIDSALDDFTRQHNAQILADTLQQAGIVAAVARRAADALYDPHMNERNFWQWRERVFVGNQPGGSAAYREGTDPIAISFTAPTLGQHNAEVLGELPGIGKAELDALEAEGVIGTQPRMPAK